MARATDTVARRNAGRPVGIMSGGDYSMAVYFEDDIQARQQSAEHQGIPFNYHRTDRVVRVGDIWKYLGSKDQDLADRIATVWEYRKP